MIITQINNNKEIKIQIDANIGGGETVNVAFKLVLAENEVENCHKMIKAFEDAITTVKFWEDKKKVEPVVEPVVEEPVEIKEED